MAPSEPVELELDPPVATLRLSRPARHNAIDGATMERLEEHLDTIEADDDVRVLIFTATGSRTFCAGGDLDYFSGLESREEGLAMSRRMQVLLDRLYRGPRPVIGAINGDAWGGGCELVTACHLRLAADNARFGFRQAAMGVVTGWGGGMRLFRLVGRAAALELLLTAEAVDATVARRLGLVDRVVPAAGLMDEAHELARRIAKNAPGSIRGFLELARAAQELPPAEARELETRLFGELWGEEHFQAKLAERRKERQNLAK